MLLLDITDAQKFFLWFIEGSVLVFSHGFDNCTILCGVTCSVALFLNAPNSTVCFSASFSKCIFSKPYKGQLRFIQCTRFFFYSVKTYVEFVLEVWCFKL